ncbi:MAG: ribonucleotide-diphosphate reductase subunit beta [Anaerolineaceae bacterium]|nr:ribonucleotide-diphosphate reductase subunit beta [Anaerolineaceae bacterium]
MIKQPLILGDRDLAEILDPPSYPDFLEAVEASHANHWRPQEIGSGDDRACYQHKLNANERALFDIQFSSLTWMDMNIPSPLFALGQLSTAAEVTQWIIRQLAEEQTHQDTYQYCAEVTGIDPDIIYTRHIKGNCPSLRTKVILARAAHECITEFNPRKFDEKLIQNLLSGVFFYSQVYEGMWFMGGFAPIYALGERGLMLNTCAQLEYIWRDENGHVQGWTRWLKLVQEQLGVNLLEKHAVATLDVCLDAEQKFAQAMFPPIVGYNWEIHMRWMRHLANLRLSNLGYIFRFEDAEAPLWIGKWQTKKEKNFFETRVTEYQTGGVLRWD